jgi:hypothetical protein
MALKKQTSIEVRLVGQVQIDAYVQIAHVAGTKNEITANAVFRKDNADGEIFQAGAYTFKPNMNNGNFIKQAYEHLKTLPEFAGAADC